MKRHPIQPLVKDVQGVVRFKGNPIVSYLLDNSPLGMNKIVTLPFEREDREQFAQLIGYSLSGFGDLEYASEETCQAAEKMYATGEADGTEARLAVATELLRDIREELREPMASLFGVHPDALKGEDEVMQVGPHRVIIVNKSEAESVVNALDEAIQDIETLDLDRRADGIERTKSGPVLETLNKFRDKLTR